MKKLFLSVTAITALLLTSCKKDRTCTCTTTYGGYTQTTVTKAKSGKKDAENWCSANQTAVTTDSGNANSITVPAPSCKIN